MGLVRVAGHASLYQCAPHHGGDPVDQGVLHAAVGDVHHAMRPELEQPQLGCAQPAPDGEPRTESIAGRLPGNHANLGQTVGPRELIERVARHRDNARLTEPGTARARRSMRAGTRTRGCGHAVIGPRISGTMTAPCIMSFLISGASSSNGTPTPFSRTTTP